MITLTWWQLALLFIITDLLLDLVIIKVVRPLICRIRMRRLYKVHDENRDGEDYE